MAGFDDPAFFGERWADAYDGFTGQPEMPDPFLYTPDDVLRMLDALMDSRGGVVG
jgi:hypothetical protein